MMTPSLKKISIVLVFAFVLLQGCVSLDVTSSDHPVMVGSKLAPKVDATDQSVILTKWVSNTTSASNTYSGDGSTQTSVSSVSNGIRPTLKYCEDNNIIMQTNHLWLDFTLFIMSGSTDESINVNFRSN